MHKEFRADNRQIMLEVDHFSLEQTFECGQCFRWDPLLASRENGHYIGVARNRVLEVHQQGKKIYLENTNWEDDERIWTSYFDLVRDYGEVIGEITKDKTMAVATKYGSGIRLLHQDEWETLVSFILSSNNNIPRIKKIIRSFCKLFGEKLKYKGEEYYTFPSPERLEGLAVGDLEEVKCGYRAKYIVDAVQKINEGQVDLYHLKNLETEKAKKELLKIKGVGPKVADCVLLFSMEKYDCYPMDVWIKKITEQLYFKGKTTTKEIQDFAKETWGEKAGFAQQYLFYYARSLSSKF